MRSPRVLPLLPLLLAAGCAQAPRAAAPTSAGHVEGAPREELAWATFSPETFARAKAERKYIVMDGSAEWCHWCHVMEATTYHDPAVRQVLDKHFIAVKVDVDSRPDLEERYGDYGWPATIMFSPDATEIGKYRGYIAPEKFVEILREVVASRIADTTANAEAATKPKAPKVALSEEHLAWIADNVDKDLDDFYDDDEGGWGRMQKAPLGMDNLWYLAKAKRGDEEAKKKVLFTLDQQSKLIDPVWGGIYQYSAARDWDHPHFEKLMTFQAPALESYAKAFELTGDSKQLERAKKMRGYIDRFMTSPAGGFYATQDADLNAHDRSKAFLSGHDYYALGDKERLSKGLPRIDTHEYARENGIAMGAYVGLFEATKDPTALTAAEKAARRGLATHATKRGGLSHDIIENGEEPKNLFLSDNAAFGWGLMRLHEATKGDAWLRASKTIADFLLTELVDEDGGGLFASTKDPDAVGIFAVRRVPFEENVMALRFFARLARATGDARYKAAIDRILRAIATPGQIKDRGRMIGDFLLALDETKGVRGALK